MTSMTALEAKNAFGQFLDAAQRSPVTVTKNGREVGAMFSRADLEAMGASYLSPPMRDAVAAGEVGLEAALLQQAAINRRIEESEADIAAGRTVVADDAFYEDLYGQIDTVASR
jgi:prevent-host-death family protein